MISHRYKPHWSHDPKPDASRCVAGVWSVGRGSTSHQCHNKPLADSEGSEWCKTHDPPRVKAKAEKRHADWRAERDRADAEADEAAVTHGLRLATVEQLKAELKRRKKP